MQLEINLKFRGSFLTEPLLLANSQHLSFVRVIALEQLCLLTARECLVDLSASGQLSLEAVGIEEGLRIVATGIVYGCQCG